MQPSPVSDEKLRQVRVLHVVSSGGATGAMQQALFMPLLTRMPKQKVKAQVVSLAPNFASGPLLRQSGIPVYDVPLSRGRFAFSSLGELLNIARQFRPDLIQAWGHTAQLACVHLRKRCDWKPKLVWSIADTAPLPKDAGFIDRRKLKMTAGRAATADRIIYTSEAAAMQHRRVGYPDGGHAVIPPGIDPMRFKPDYAARRKVREQLGLASDAFVIGMAAPFMPEFDHATLLKGVGELIKTRPEVTVILCGHGVQKGNAPLMALVGGGQLSMRTHLLGEWSDTSSFLAACDVACSSSLTDGSRMTVVMAMLCGIPCVATGMGAQGEVLGRFGVAIEPGSAPAIVRGITRVLEMPEDRRIAMVQGARKHALSHYVSVLSLQKYLQLYYDIVGRQALADVPAPQVDASIPVPPPDAQPSSASSERTLAAAAALVSLHQITDPDSLESQVPEVTGGYKAPPPSPPPVAKERPPAPEGDVLKLFESDLKDNGRKDANPMGERARGVAEELGDLLAPEVLQAASPVAAGKSKAPKSQPGSAESGTRENAANEAAVKAKPTASPPKPVPQVMVKSAPEKPVSESKPLPPVSQPEVTAKLSVAAEPAAVAVEKARHTPVQLPMLLEGEVDLESESPRGESESSLQLRLLDDDEPFAAAS